MMVRRGERTLHPPFLEVNSWAPPRASPASPGTPAQPMTADAPPISFTPALLEVLAARTDNGIIVCGSDRRIQWVNAGFSRLTGYAAAEVVGLHPGRLLQGAQSDAQTVSELHRALDLGQACSVDIRNYRKDGSVFWNHIEIHPVHDAQGSLSCFIAVVTDIDPAKQALESLSIHGERLERALSIGDTAVWEWDLALGRVWSTQRAKTMLGYAPDELIDTVETWEQLIHPDEGAAVEASVQQCLSGARELYRHEYRLRHKDGSWRWILDQGRIVDRDPAGNALRMVGTHTDTTELHVAATALAESETRLRKVAAQVPGMLYQVLLRPDGSMAFPYASEGILPLYGLTPAEAARSAAPVLERLHPDDRERVGAAIAASARDLSQWDCEYRYCHPDGRVLWLHGHGNPERLADGTVLWHGYNTEISERKRGEEHLRQALHDAEQATRSKSAFLATMSHEIRTPLNGVIGMVELMRMGEMAPSQQESVAVIHASANNLLQILNDILDYSKLEEGAAQVERVPFSPAGVVEDALRVVHLKAREKGLALSRELSPGLPAQLVGDPSKLRQILFNLLGNAVKFTASGRVELRLNLVRSPGGGGGGMLEITVTDSGIGMDASVLAQLFQPFTQADASMSRRYGGSGLGLAISRGLAVLMGGSLEASSVPGQGSTFRCRIPVAIPAAVPIASAPAAPAVERGAAVPRPARWSGRALVVEDNAVNQNVARAMLSRLGLNVTVCFDGASALAQLSNGGFDLVFMDCMMPVMDGLEATRRARAQGVRVPIIAITANAMPNDRVACLEAGMDDYLAKPITLERLNRVLERFLPAPTGGSG